MDPSECGFSDWNNRLLNPYTVYGNQYTIPLNRYPYTGSGPGIPSTYFNPYAQQFLGSESAKQPLITGSDQQGAGAPITDGGASDNIGRPEQSSDSNAPDPEVRQVDDSNDRPHSNCQREKAMTVLYDVERNVQGFQEEVAKKYDELEYEVIQMRNKHRQMQKDISQLWDELDQREYYGRQKKRSRAGSLSRTTRS